MTQEYPSKLLERAVQQFAGLPGIGRKTALRHVLFLMRQTGEQVEQFADAILTLKRDVHFCSRCHNISDTELCSICSDGRRDATTICVVENIQDVMAVENTEEYKGLYHVLGGLISPVEGIAPGDIEIESLVRRVAEGGVKEIILALSPTMEGDTTSFYIFRKLSPYHVDVTILARGVSVGNELEYTDEVTLGRSILNRVPFNQ